MNLFEKEYAKIANKTNICPKCGLEETFLVLPFIAEILGELLCDECMGKRLYQKEVARQKAAAKKQKQQESEKSPKEPLYKRKPQEDLF